MKISTEVCCTFGDWPDCCFKLGGMGGTGGLGEHGETGALGKLRRLWSSKTLGDPMVGVYPGDEQEFAEDEIMMLRFTRDFSSKI